ncbi:hypothetical protein [Sedimentitalea arenosa]|uniref:Surface antigen domain-containing protein n=1 Tax=Sedimentitalea arenosa TaxID=2798803 RepID=A0A8J7LVN9_9RHOB|nr:hypothetical protein [Arenibacterium arenosum]MBJ6371325.1 hypothetical protein [Arenibacterium arenosum]
MRPFPIALCALLILSVAPQAGFAKPLSKIVAQAGLSPEDFKIMSATEDALIAPAPKAGRNATWDNPESGSKGIVEVTSVRDGCAYIRHVFHPKGRDASEELKFRKCKASDGVWRLTP